MSMDSANLPAARHWRNIPQQVRPRAMSREGRRRVAVQILRWAGGSAAFALVAWGAWQAADVRRGNPGAGGVPLRRIALATDGVLDQSWLVRTLALPGRATLAELDLSQLRTRILASGQAGTATLVREFPATLSVRVSERLPVARVMASEGAAVRRPLLVARDGVVYEGAGYDSAMLASLPWLDGVTLVRRDGGYAPIDGMGRVADLLGQAKLDAEPLYRTWRVVSLSRLLSDGEIEVRASGGLRVIFGTREDFFRQIARLDLLLDTAQARGAGPVTEVNLALGPHVPVTIAGDPAAIPSFSIPTFAKISPPKREF